MVIIEAPYVSDFFLAYLAENEIPALDNAFARQFTGSYELHLVSDAEMVSRYQEGERLYLSSENALGWVYEHLKDEPIVQAVNRVKDKGKFRALTKALCPDLFYQTVAYEELFKLDISQFTLPVILKPAVGFFSLGVYVIRSREAWEKALEDIKGMYEKWQGQFPDSVVAVDEFLIEGYIEGTEYAIDAYYDDAGIPVILNIFTHRFASEEDVSDRIYYTDKEMIETYKGKFEAFLAKMNETLKLRAFPMHVEMRVKGEQIIPIEINPLRFAGMSCTDIAYYAYGINTVKYYLEDQRPDFKSILEEKKDEIYSMIVLDKKDPNLSSSEFDYDKLMRDFEHPIALRKVDHPSLDIFGFLFTETRKEKTAELDHILVSDLMCYMRA